MRTTSTTTPREPKKPSPASVVLHPIRHEMAGIVTLAALGGVAEIGMYIALVEAARYIVTNHGLTSAGDPHFWWILAAALVCVLLRYFLIMGATGYAHVVEAKFRATTRRRILAKLDKLPLGWFDEQTSGRVRATINDAVTNIHTVVAHSAADLPNSLTTVIVGFIYLFVCDWRMTLVVLAYLVLVVLVSVLGFVLSDGNIMVEYTEAQKQLSESAVEIADGIAEVKNFGLTGQEFKRFEDASARYQKSLDDYMSGFGKPQGATTGLMIPGAMLIPLMVAGALMAWKGIVQPVDLMPFLLLGLGMPEAIGRLYTLTSYIFHGANSISEIGTLLLEPDIEETDNPQPLTGNTIELKGVSFSYAAKPNGKSADEADAALAVDTTATADSSATASVRTEVLHDISLTMQPGTVTALVGPSGSGKTTITRLIARFWEPDSGTVEIDGVNICDVSTQELMHNMAIVFQDISLLSDTVTNNIRIARPDATQQEVIAAAKAARIHDRIMELPQGYDTIVGSDSAYLSGGEQQRLTIARAFLQDAPIVLLDEATAYADPHSERAIQEALADLRGTRTVVVIAHRLHTIQDVDQIVVLNHGRIEAAGTHSELLDTSPTYCGMWTAQQDA